MPLFSLLVVQEGNKSVSLIYTPSFGSTDEKRLEQKATTKMA